MHYQSLGKSGLKVSPLCLGGMTFGDDWHWGASAIDSASIINRFLEAGGNFIDTSNVYTNGHSEKIVGDTVGKYASKRTGVVIGTKFAANAFPGNPNGGGTGTKAIFDNLHQSLRRLQTDYIDLLWVHQWDWNTPFEETMRTLDRLVASGKVRHIGVSYAPAWKIAQAQATALLKDWTPFIGLQIEYSLLQRTIEDELVPMAAELGLGITAWSPLKGGLLSGKYTRANQGHVAGSRLGSADRAAELGPRELAIIDQLDALAQEHGATPAAIALAWVMSRPATASTIIGVRTPEQLEANLAALDIRLAASELAALDELSAPPPTFVTMYREYARSFIHGGIEINGVTPSALPSIQQTTPRQY